MSNFVERCITCSEHKRISRSELQVRYGKEVRVYYCVDCDTNPPPPIPSIEKLATKVRKRAQKQNKQADVPKAPKVAPKPEDSRWANIDEQIKEAIALLKESGKPFSRIAVCQKIKTSYQFLRDNYPHLMQMTEDAVTESMRLAIAQAIEDLDAQQRSYTIIEVRKTAGIKSSELFYSRPELVEIARAAVSNSRQYTQPKELQLIEILDRVLPEKRLSVKDFCRMGRITESTLRRGYPHLVKRINESNEQHKRKDVKNIIPRWMEKKLRQECGAIAPRQALRIEERPTTFGRKGA